MTPSMRWFGTSILGLFLTSTLCAAGDSDGPRHRVRQRIVERIDRRAEIERRLQPLHERRLAPLRERRLQLSREQREQALEAARAAAPIVERARKDAERARIEMREARREGDTARRHAARSRLGEVRKSRSRDLEPLARSFVATLSAQQREILARLASLHGSTLDEHELARLIARALARPSTVPRLESKLGR